MRRGLVLEGGGMRGLYTAGAMDAFMEQGLSFDGLVGVSAGAVFGCNFKSGQVGRVLRYNTRFCRDPRYISLRSLLSTGDLYGERPDGLTLDAIQLGKNFRSTPSGHHRHGMTVDVPTQPTSRAWSPQDRKSHWYASLRDKQKHPLTKARRCRIW